MKIYFVALSIITLFPSNIFAQSVDEFKWFGKDYEDQTFISLGANKINVSNKKAFNPKNHDLSGVTLKFDCKKYNYDKGAGSFSYENKLIGDLIWLGSKIFDDQSKIYANEETTLTSGLVGWYTRLWNLTEPNKFQFMTGLNLKDFNLVITEPKDRSRPFANPTNLTINNPAGNYYTIGPSIGARYNLFNKFLVEYHSDLSIPFGKLNPTSNNYNEEKKVKNPYFINHVIELVSSKGLFVGYEYISIIQRAVIETSPVRRELYVGFRIPI